MFHLCCVRNKCSPLFSDGREVKTWAGRGGDIPSIGCSSGMARACGIEPRTLKHLPTPSRKKEILAKACASQAKEP